MNSEEWLCVCVFVCKKERERARDQAGFFFPSADSEQCRSPDWLAPRCFLWWLLFQKQSDIRPDLRDHSTSETLFHSSLTIHSFDISLYPSVPICFYTLPPLSSSCFSLSLFFFLLAKTDNSVDKERSDVKTEEPICLKMLHWQAI